MLNASNSITPNLYAYCDNDPINYIDPTGYIFITTTMLICAGIGAILGALVGWGYYKYFNIPSDRAWIYIFGGALIGAFLGGCVGYAASGGGAVLWSGTTAEIAAAEFARQNGLAVLSQTLRGKLLQILQRFLPYSTMQHLWEAQSMRFLLSYANTQKYVHVFIDANAYANIESIFYRIELQVISELGFKIVWHFLK